MKNRDYCEPTLEEIAALEHRIEELDELVAERGRRVEELEAQHSAAASVVTIEPGDTLVISFPGRITEAVFHRLVAQVAAIKPPGGAAIVLEDGGRVTVVKGATTEAGR